LLRSSPELSTDHQSDRNFSFSLNLNIGIGGKSLLALDPCLTRGFELRSAFASATGASMFVE